ncbi:MAG: hypothetical protein IJU87_08605 [Lachnospiraceae bacterium]|nr:hypothetical protein [Lachnospiraceae bacterium]
MGKKPFHDWERKHDLLNNKNINGFQYWNYMRRDMGMSFSDEYTKVEPAFYRNMSEQGKEGIKEKLKKALLLLIPDRKGEPVRSDIMFLCHSRRQEIDGKMVSIYTDPVSDRFPGSVTVQRSGLGRYDRNKIYSKRLVFLDKISVMSYIYRYFVRFFRRREYLEIKNRVLKEMEEPFRDLAGNYDLHPDPNDFAERVTVLYYLYRYRKPRFRRIIEKISPRVIVEVVGLSFDAKIINELASELNIETVELQHGVGGLSFYYPEGTRMKQFAKWYFAFGDFWRDRMQPPIPRDHILSVGFPFFERQMRDYPEESRNRESGAVIFISSRKYGRELSGVASAFKRMKPETDVIYKLHPREYPDYKKKYASLEGEGIRVIADDRIPLYTLFSSCSAQVGVDSTAVYEGMGFGLNTFIWDIPRAVFLRPLVDGGYARLFKDAAELSEMMEAGAEKREYDTGLFWKEGSLDRMEREISRIAGLRDSAG